MLSLITVVVYYHARLLNPLLEEQLLLFECEFINLVIIQVARFHRQLIFVGQRLLAFGVIQSHLNVGSCAAVSVGRPTEGLGAIPRLASTLLL